MYQLEAHWCGPTRIAPARTAQGADHAQVVVVDNDHRDEGGAVKTDQHAAQRVPVLTRDTACPQGVSGFGSSRQGICPDPPRPAGPGTPYLTGETSPPVSFSPPRFSKIYLHSSPSRCILHRVAGPLGDTVMGSSMPCPPLFCPWFRWVLARCDDDPSRNAAADRVVVADHRVPHDHHRGGRGRSGRPVVAGWLMRRLRRGGGVAAPFSGGALRSP